MKGQRKTAVERNEARLATLTSPGHTLTQAHSSTKIESESPLLAFFGSPRAILVLVPLLVFALGAALTIIGQIALGATSRTMARDRFVSDTASVARGLEGTLGQAEPLLDELARIATSAQPLEPSAKKNASLGPYDTDRLSPVALEMRDLLVGRPGITQAYIAYPDGTFLSADPSGARTVGIQVTQKGISASYQVKGQKVRHIDSRKSKYDPRLREWYKLALAQGKRVWSAPYTFFFNHHTGVTRSFPLYEDEAKTEVLAVVGVDFDVDTLTAFMAVSESDETEVHSVVFNRGGIVLAYPRGAEKLTALQEDKQVPTHQALGDAELSALIRKVQADPSGANGRGLLSFAVGNNRMLASVRTVGAGGPDWYVATFSPERSVLRELYDHRKSSLWVGTLSLLFAVSLAWFLARRLLFVRRAAHRAQVAALHAQDQVRDLGSYRLVSRIGEGGMGEVWRASHRLLARQAAIKLIKSGPAAPERKQEQRERFRREAQAIAGLRSRHTIALYDFGVTPDDTLFYVMELLDGIDLNSLVQTHGAQNPERVRQILIQACNSLSEAHNAQLVHRDIKPANLFLCREAEDVDVLKVLDFGLVFQAGTMDDPSPLPSTSRPSARNLPTKAGAKPPPPDATETLPTAAHSGRITQADHQLGTPAFMSPEQALGSGTDGRSDIYSLACVAWWLLCGRPPFSADSMMALMVMHIETPLPNLNELSGFPVTEQFESLIGSCLAKSPLDRPQSAQDLGDRLRALGVQPPGFAEAEARAWWKEHMPERKEPETKLGSQPLRDADVIPPYEAS